MKFQVWLYFHELANLSVRITAQLKYLIFFKKEKSKETFLKIGSLGGTTGWNTRVERISELSCLKAQLIIGHEETETRCFFFKVCDVELCPVKYKDSKAICVVIKVRMGCLREESC